MLPRTDKDCIVLFQRYVSLHYGERFFLDGATATNLKEREIYLVEPVSSLLKLVCNLKHLSCEQFHNIVKGNSAFLRNVRKLKLQNIHGLTRKSKSGFCFVCFD